MEEYNLNSKFDVQKHKETFIHYLEIMIDENGKACYAVPSHQEMAIQMVCDKFGWTRKQVEDNTPEAYYFDWLRWLLSLSGAIAVWEDRYIGNANKAQKAKLRFLKLNGLYTGKI